MLKQHRVAAVNTSQLVVSIQQEQVTVAEALARKPTQNIGHESSMVKILLAMTMNQKLKPKEMWTICTLKRLYSTTNLQ